MKPPAQPNQSLIDGLSVLQLLAGATRPLGVRELARELDLEPTRANRLVKTLAHLGLTEQNAQRKYQAGPGIHVLAAQAMFGSGLIRRAIGPLEGLHRFGLSVALGVLWRDKVAYLYHADAGMPAAQALGRVGLFPAGASGIGIALLAERTLKDVRTLVAGAAGASRAVDAVRAAKQQGYAVAEREDGTRSLGVAIPRAPHPVAAIAIASAPRGGREAEIVAAMQAAADEISQGEAA